MAQYKDIIDYKLQNPEYSGWDPVELAFKIYNERSDLQEKGVSFEKFADAIGVREAQTEAAPDRGVLGEVGAHVKRGVRQGIANFLKFGQIALPEAIEPSDAYIEDVEAELTEDPSYQRGKLTYTSPTADYLTRGVESGITSVTGAAPGMVAGTLAGGPLGTLGGMAVGGALSGGTVFGGAEYYDTMKEAHQLLDQQVTQELMAKGVPEEQARARAREEVEKVAHPQALKSAFAEAGFEAAGNLLDLLILGRGARTLTGPIREGAKQKLAVALKQYAKNVAMVAPVEVTSELATTQAQHAAHKPIYERAGIAVPDLSEQMKDTFLTTLAATATVFAPMGTAGQGAARYKQVNALRGLGYSDDAIGAMDQNTIDTVLKAKKAADPSQQTATTAAQPTATDGDSPPPKKKKKEYFPDLAPEPPASAGKKKLDTKIAPKPVDPATVVSQPIDGEGLQPDVALAPNLGDQVPGTGPDRVYDEPATVARKPTDDADLQPDRAIAPNLNDQAPGKGSDRVYEGDFSAEDYQNWDEFFPDQDRGTVEVPEKLRSEIVKKTRPLLNRMAEYGIARGKDTGTNTSAWKREVNAKLSGLSGLLTRYKSQKRALDRGYKGSRAVTPEMLQKTVDQIWESLDFDPVDQRFRPIDPKEYPGGEERFHPTAASSDGAGKRKMTNVHKVDGHEVGLVWDYENKEPSYWTVIDDPPDDYLGIGATPEEAVAEYSKTKEQSESKDAWLTGHVFTDEELVDLGNADIRSIARARGLEGAENKKIASLRKAILQHQQRDVFKRQRNQKIIDHTDVENTGFAPQPKNEIPEDLRDAFDLMVNDAHTTESRGVAKAADGSLKGYAASSPPWLKDLNEKMKKEGQHLFSRSEISSLVSKKEFGDKLTDKQQARWEALEDAARKLAAEHPDLIAADDIKEIEKKGFEFVGRLKMTVGDLNEGDKFYGKVDGVEDEYTHAGFLKDGDVILQDGRRKVVDIFEVVEVQGIKRKKNIPLPPQAQAPPETATDLSATPPETATDLPATDLSATPPETTPQDMPPVRTDVGDRIEADVDDRVEADEEAPAKSRYDIAPEQETESLENISFVEGRLPKWPKQRDLAETDRHLIKLHTEFSPVTPEHAQHLYKLQRVLSNVKADPRFTEAALANESVREVYGPDPVFGYGGPPVMAVFNGSVVFGPIRDAINWRGFKKTKGSIPKKEWGDLVAVKPLPADADLSSKRMAAVHLPNNRIWQRHITRNEFKALLDQHREKSDPSASEIVHSAMPSRQGREQWTRFLEKNPTVETLIKQATGLSPAEFRKSIAKGNFEHLKKLFNQGKLALAKDVPGIESFPRRKDWRDFLQEMTGFTKEQLNLDGIDDAASPSVQQELDFAPSDTAAPAEEPGAEKNLSSAPVHPKVQEWKDYARKIGQENPQHDKTIVSLFDRTGVWAQPWVDAGYNVIQIDTLIEDAGGFGYEQDIHEIDIEWIQDHIEAMDTVDGVLAAPPCTDFAASGARWWKAKDEKGITEESLHLVHQVMKIVEYLQPDFWVLENPVGRLPTLIEGMGKPQMYFQPNDYGHPYTKKTGLWGDFNIDLPKAEVEATEGSRAHKLWGTDPAQKAARSETPEGFAYAFFMANHPVVQEGFKSKINDDEAAQQYLEDKLATRFVPKGGQPSEDTKDWLAPGPASQPTQPPTSENLPLDPTIPTPPPPAPTDANLNKLTYDEAAVEALRKKAKEAYTAGNLEIPHYMAVIELLHRKEYDKVGDILAAIGEGPNLAEKKLTAKSGMDEIRMLKMVGRQMYKGALVSVTIKETVQNSFDAVRELAEQKGKGRLKDGKIDIIADRSSRIIAIRDNGGGMSMDRIGKFLTVAGADKGELADPSGGFGMAKAVFLYGTEWVQVNTKKRGGKRYKFRVEGEKSYGKDIDIQSEDGPNAEHGTVIIIKIPKTEIVDGQEKAVDFPYNTSNIDFFKKPMLHPNIEVRLSDDSLSARDLDSLSDPNSSAWDAAEYKVLPLGKNYDLSAFEKYTTARFSWGHADVHIGIEREPSSWMRHHSVLSAGIYQFDTISIWETMRAFRLISL